MNMKEETVAESEESIDNNNHARNVKDLTLGIGSIDMEHPLPSPPTSSSPSSSPIIICDAWYGFPKQARPRKERIHAVAKQLYNFQTWREEHLSSANANANANAKTNKQHNHGICHMYVIGAVEDVHAIQNRMAQLIAKGKDKDKGDPIDTTLTSKNNTYTYSYIYLPGESLECLVEKLTMTTTITSTSTSTSVQHEEAPEKKEDTSDSVSSSSSMVMIKTGTETEAQAVTVTYLSPDAEDTLSASHLPPSIVVVGMLVDRKVQTHRSKHRVEALTLETATNMNTTTTSSINGSNGIDSDGNATSTCTHDEDNTVDDVESGDIPIPPIVPKRDCIIRAGRLPLDALNVSDLTTDEPLNIDTVMEMMQRWWFHSYRDKERDKDKDKARGQRRGTEGKQEQKQQVQVEVGEKRRRKTYFRDAAARSMLTHRQRHPNRTIHGTCTSGGKVKV